MVTDLESEAAEARVRELTRERDEALGDIERHMRTIHKRDRLAEVAESEVTRLTEALAAAEASHLCGEKESRLIAAESRVDALTEELASARRHIQALTDAGEAMAGGKLAAEARVRELEADIERYAHGKLARRCAAAESLVVELTRERDIAEIHERELRALQLKHESEVTRLTEALAARKLYNAELALWRVGEK